MFNYKIKEEITTILSKGGYFRGFIPLNNLSTKSLSAKFGIKGRLEIDSQHYAKIHIIFGAYFPLELPVVIIKETNLPKSIPHLYNQKGVCYYEPDNLLIDTGDIRGILHFVLERVRYTLRQATNPYLAIHEFNRELEQYWNNHTPKKIYALLDLQYGVHYIKLAKHFEKTIVGEREDTIRNTFHDENNYKNRKFSFRDAIFIGLQNPTIPFLAIDFTDSSVLFKRIYENLNIQDRKKLIAKLAKKTTSITMIIHLPLANGNNALIGIKIKRPKFENLTYTQPLVLKKSSKIILYQIKRLNQNYITQRGGGIMTLKDKKIALIGCGSIGGYIATEIAKTGIGHLTLIDAEKLEAENIYRHSLGLNALGQFKTKALKKKIRAEIPYIQVNTMESTIQEVISNKKINFPDYDLVISAIGNDTIELYLNHLFQQNQNYPPLVFSWVEPYGIGGHVLVTNNRDKNGCLKCLYRNTEVGYHNISSFLQPNQNFDKAISGCGSLFTPYSGLDALRSAILTIQIALEILQGKETDNSLQSWKGSKTEIEKNDGKVSNRFNVSNEILTKYRYDYKYAYCSHCKQKRLND